MTTPPRWTVVLGLLVLMTGFGLAAVTSTPDGGRGIGIWPVALGTATLLVSPRPAARWWLPVLAALATGTLLLGGRSPGVAVGLGVGLAGQMGVTWWLLCHGRRERPLLLTVVDLARLGVAVTAGGLLMAAVSAATSLATGWGSPALLALTTGSAGIAAHLGLLPFFCRYRRQPPLAGPGERWAQWVVLVAVTLAVMTPTDFPSLALLVLPVLAWGALRGTTYASLTQMAVAVGVAMPVTSAGHGPFARPDLRFGLPVDLQGIVLAAFATVCALVVLALRLSVGEQQEYARQVSAERDRLRSVVDGVTAVAVIGADLEGRITLFNPGAQRLLGHRPAEVLGRPTRLLHSAAGITAKAAELGVPDDYREVALALMDAGPTRMGFVRKDGEERQHWMSLARVTDDRGEPIGYVSTSEDITERLRAEARLVEALEAERQAVERLQEVDRVKDAFVAGVSHELRTPITSILGYTELLGDGELGALSPRQGDAVDRIARNSRRLLTLISELLTLSRVQETGAPGPAGAPGTVPVDLGQVVTAALAVLSPTVARRHVELRVDLPEAPLRVVGDRDMLERVVLNLADNAVKFTPDGGRVSVALSRRPGGALLEVVDTGIGVPAAEQARLFDRFFRSTLAQQQAIPGTGLGLSIAHKIVEQHGGRLEVDSEAGRGSTFRVLLPA